MSISEAINRYLSYPPLEEKDLVRKKTHFIWNTTSLIAILILTVLGFALGADIIGIYGLCMLPCFIITYYGFRTKIFDVYTYVFLALITLITGVFVLIFGGLLHSAGIFFAGLTCAMSAALLNRAKWSIVLGALYLLTILLAAVLDPYLSVHPDITPEVNFLYFTINLLWMSAVLILFILTYIKEKSDLEETETNRMRELDEAKTRLYTGITHEFRTPLTLILGMAERIREGEEDTIHGAELITRNGRKLLRLINQMLGLAKLESGTLQLQLVQDDIVKHVRYILESFHSLAKVKGIDLDFTTDLAECVMDFDAEKMEDVITNLVSNALKFTDSGGSVKVRLTTFPADSGHRERLLEISIADNGSGIPSAALPNIFKPYYQAAPTIGASTWEGTGIGLTVVKEYLQLMGSEVLVDSAEGVGTTFYVRIPIHHRAERADATRSHRSSDGSSSKLEVESSRSAELPEVLLVEDNEDVAVYIASILSDCYKVKTAVNGEEGLLAAKSDVPDIILSDVMMPVMDGYQMLARLKASQETSHIPVVMLTAKADLPSKLAGYEHGAEAYLTKPFQKDELRGCLRSLLEQRKVLQAHYSAMPGRTDLPIGNSVDDKFMKKLTELLEDHLGDEQLDVPMLCREMGLSHTQLYRKFAALTNTPVARYIRKYRLHKARQLLEDWDLNVAQVAAKVGIGSPSNFTRAFTSEFGFNPSQVRQPH